MNSVGQEEFPQYRQFVGGAHLYRIEGPDRFVELQRIGKGWVRHTVRAEAYPEKVRIREMLDNVEGRYPLLAEEAWQTAENDHDRMV
jgi:hypothetical protein